MRLRGADFPLAFSTGLLPLGAIALAQIGLPLNLTAWFPLVFILGIVLWLDALFGSETANPVSADENTQRERSTYSAC